MKRFYIGDLVVTALVLLLAVAAAAPFLMSSGKALTLEVEQDGRIVRRVLLAEGYRETITVPGPHGSNTIVIEGRTARMAAAGCPDQVCVRTGLLTRAGQSTVCLPNRVIVRLTGVKQDGEVDAIIG